MTTLKKIWIEHGFGEKRAIRIDWKNGRHQRIEIEDNSPEAVARALKDAGAMVNAERVKGEI